MNLQDIMNYLWDTLSEHYSGSSDISDRVKLIRFLKVLDKLDLI